MTDLQAYEIQLTNMDGPLPVHSVRGDSLRGLFYKHTDPKLAELLHSYGQKGNEHLAAPYSVSILSKEVDIKGKRENVLTGIRIAAFQSDLGNRLVEIWGALAVKKGMIKLGNASLRVESIQPASLSNLSYAQIWEQSQPAFGLSIKFETVTLLERNGHLDRLPIPHVLWGYYLRRWEQYSPVDLPPHLLTWVEKCAYTRSISIAIDEIPINGNVSLKGFKGTVDFHIAMKDDSLPESRIKDYLRSWQMLAAFAEFCGTGENTTEGFGRTRYVRAFGLQAEE